MGAASAVPPEDPVHEAQVEARRWLLTAQGNLLGATAMLERDDVAKAALAATGARGSKEAAPAQGPRRPLRRTHQIACAQRPCAPRTIPVRAPGRAWCPWRNIPGR